MKVADEKSRIRSRIQIHKSIRGSGSVSNVTDPEHFLKDRDFYRTDCPETEDCTGSDCGTESKGRNVQGQCVQGWTVEGGNVEARNVKDEAYTDEMNGERL